MTLDVSPFGCRWCGTARRLHGRRYVAGADVHGWERPTNEQIKLRMQTRRAARKGGEAL